MNRGFSLIESIVYIALLGFIMAGAIGSVFLITQNSHVLSGKNTVQEEGTFVLRKIEHAFVGAADLSVSGSTLVIDPYGAGPNITFSLSGGTLFVNRGLGGEEITTDNVSVDEFELTQHAGLPKGVTATTTIDGVEFVITKYVR